MAQQKSAFFALAANTHLADAPDWSSFKVNNRRASMDAAEVIARSQPSQLLDALVPAMARGMQLLSEQQLDVTTLQQQEPGVQALVMLIAKWGLARRAEDRPAKEHAPLVLALAVSPTGMLWAYAQVCRTLARFISCPAAHGAVAAAAFKRSSIPQLIAQQLWLLRVAIEDWPGGKALSNPAVVAAFTAASELAVAALRNTNTYWTLSAVPGSSRRQRQNISSSTSKLCQNTAEAAVVLTFTICHGSPASVLPESVAGSSAVMQLMMAHLALTAQTIHQQQRGLAAIAAGGAGTSAQQQQQVAVPAYHQQLLDALGLAGAFELPLLEEGACLCDVMLYRALSGVRCVRFQRPHSSSNSSSSSSLGAATGRQQQQAGAAVDASLLAPLLFALLECCLLLECSTLLPPKAAAALCLCTMEQLVTGCRDFIPESLARDLPPAMLQQLLPAIRAADAAAAPAAASAAAIPTPDLAELAAAVLLALSTNVACTAATQRGEDDWQADSTARALAAAFLEQPQQYCAWIEGPVRSRVASGVMHAAWASAVAALLSAAAACASSEGISLSAGKQQQVFSLLISCLKAVVADAAAMAAGGVAAGTAWPFAAALLKTASEVRQACALLLPRTSSSSQAGAKGAAAVGLSSSRLAVHLLGRCLVAAGRTGRLASSVDPSLLSEWAQGLQQLLADMAQQLLLLSPPAVPERVMQQLLGEQAALQQQVQALLDQPAAGAAGPSAAVASSSGLSGLAQQLEAFGAAVCAQAPAKECCNHHLCGSSGRHSELELVSGKSCVCSGCRAARYCSRECQVAHYKSWHRAVCKQLQQQAAQQQ